MTGSRYQRPTAGGAPGLRHIEPDAADRQTDSLAALALVLALVVAGLFLVRVLHAKCAVEDCLLAGRRDCDVVLARTPPVQPFGP